MPLVIASRKGATSSKIQTSDPHGGKEKLGYAKKADGQFFMDAEDFATGCTV